MDLISVQFGLMLFLKISFLCCAVSDDLWIKKDGDE